MEPIDATIKDAPCAVSYCGYEKKPTPLPSDRNNPGADQLQPARTYTHANSQPLAQRDQLTDHTPSDRNDPTQPQPEPITHTYTSHQPNPQPDPAGVQRA